MVGRDPIEASIRRMVDAENDRSLSAAEKVAVIDAVMSEDITGWINGVAQADRAADRERELEFYGMVPDYCRTLRNVVVDPPRIAFDWVFTGTNEDLGLDLEVCGCSIMEFGEDGRAAHYWVYIVEPTADSDASA